MSWALTLALLSLLFGLFLLDERRAWRFGFALGWFVAGVTGWPRRLRSALAHRLFLLRIAITWRWYRALPRMARHLPPSWPGSAWLRRRLARSHRRWRLRLLAAVAHLHLETPANG